MSIGESGQVSMNCALSLFPVVRDALSGQMGIITLSGLTFPFG